jgi:hypothetical protein
VGILKNIVIGSLGLVLMSGLAFAQGLSGWSDKTVCRLVEQQGKQEYIDEAKNRSLSCVGTHEPAPDKVSYWDDINHSTSRYVRNQIGCYVSTNPNTKPALLGRDNIIVSSVNSAFADLNNDGRPEFISGAFDEPMNDEWKSEHHPDHLSRNRKPWQYMFFSPDSSFEVPRNTEFMMARTILPQDFNGDDVDDLVFVQHGPDSPPYVEYPNKILLSQSDGGHVVKMLLGPKSLYHGGAAGDIDNDGDVDIVVTPGAKNQVVAYINDGKGNFSYRALLQKQGRNYNAILWDVDGDGYLDLMIDGGKELLKIFWGKGNGRFSEKAQIIKGFDGATMQDIVIGDFLGNGGSQLVVVSSNEGVNRWGFHNFYKGFSVMLAPFEGRIQKVTVTLSSNDVDWLWLARIHSCDLQNDGDLDIVFEQSGERWHSPQSVSDLDFRFIDKLLWVNKGGKFEFVKIEDPRYFQEDDREGIFQKAKSYGVTVSKYNPAQMYNDNNGSSNVYVVNGGKRFSNYTVEDIAKKQKQDLVICKLSVSNERWKSGAYEKIYVRKAQADGLTIGYCMDLMSN